MEQFLEFATPGVIVAALSYFIWWKRQLHDELVKPDVNAINQRIDFLETRATKLEDLYDRISDNLENKIDNMQATITALSKEVATLNGQLQMLIKEHNKSC